MVLKGLHDPRVQGVRPKLAEHGRLHRRHEQGQGALSSPPPSIRPPSSSPSLSTSRTYTRGPAQDIDLRHQLDRQDMTFQ